MWPCAHAASLRVSSRTKRGLPEASAAATSATSVWQASRSAKKAAATSGSAGATARTGEIDSAADARRDDRRGEEVIHGRRAESAVDSAVVSSDGAGRPRPAARWRSCCATAARATPSWAARVGLSASAVDRARAPTGGVRRDHRVHVRGRCRRSSGCRSRRWSGCAYPNANYRPFHQLLDTTPEIVEAHHVTGEDCFVLTVRARSMRHLEEVTGRIGGLGARHDERRLLEPTTAPVRAPGPWGPRPPRRSAAQR